VTEVLTELRQHHADPRLLLLRCGTEHHFSVGPPARRRHSRTKQLRKRHDKRAHGFTRIDTMDPNAPAELFAQDATVVFGNGEPMVGRDAIVARSAAFLATIKGISHYILNEWTA